jgi:hypothetical protein
LAKANKRKMRRIQEIQAAGLEPIAQVVERFEMANEAYAAEIVPEKLYFATKRMGSAQFSHQ